MHQLERSTRPITILMADDDAEDLLVELPDDTAGTWQRCR
jgi:hypothetical protein